MAFFVNRYDSSGDQKNIHLTLKVSTGYYLIGSAHNKGYVSKLDNNGNVEWAKSYHFVTSQTTTIGFTKVIDTGQGLILAFSKGYSSDHIVGLCLIDYMGNVKWCKRFFLSSNHPINDPQIQNRSAYPRSMFLFDNNIHLAVVENIRRINMTEYNRLFFYKINSNGNILIVKSKIFDLSSWYSGVGHVGNQFIIHGNQQHKGYIGVVDNSFNSITGRLLENTNSNVVTNTSFISFVDANNSYLCGLYRDENVSNHFYILKFNTTNFTINLFKYFSKVGTAYTSLKAFGNDIYIKTSHHGIFKFDNSINFIWNKQIETVNNYIEVSNSDIITSLTDNGVAVTNMNYDSCITNTNSTSISPQSNNNFTFNNVGQINLESTSENTININSIVTNLQLSKNIICPQGNPQPDLNKSTIIAVPTAIPANGISTSTVTVQLNDSNGNPITSGGPYTVVITASAGTPPQSSGVVNSIGQFITTLTSSVAPATSLLKFRLSTSLTFSPNTATVQFVTVGETISITKRTLFQSPYLYLQASGSDGSDSTKGKHLRWAFRGVLGEKHLPKGNLASGTANFNKPNDFVKIYKAAYRKKTVILNFLSHIPTVVDHSNYLWIYRVGGKEFYVHFKNQAKYDQVKTNTNPFTNSSLFIANYGSELIEVENIKELFFAVTCNFSLISIIPDRSFQVETLSVDKNSLTANKVVSNRRTLGNSQVDAPLRLIMENGRTVRWQIFNARLASLEFEFYLDTIVEINNTTGWVSLGDFSLTTNQLAAYTRLEPVPGDVHGVWERFNDNSLVNVNNYQEKWDGTPETGDKNIKQVIERYIFLSNNVNNPAAIENIPLENDPMDPEDYMEISHLDLLNFSANDYHIARMLGLGVLDKHQSSLEQEVNTLNVYVAEYNTYADLEDGEGARTVQHLFMSLPTSNNDFRLPVPVNLSHLIPGVYIGGENGDSSPLTDEDGYSHDGMSRYVSLYNEELPEDVFNPPFFPISENLNISTYTTPVYGGLKYRINEEDWYKPELSNDSKYLNVVAEGDPYAETRFILIPEPLKPFYVHRQVENGVHRYRSYGINWFSRYKVGDTEINIETWLKQKNPLIPPSNINALLIRQESPLLLTSGSEQERLAAINGDKTLIRLTYDYHSFHELKNYNVPLDSPLTNTQLLDPLALFPDNDEIFADQVEIFFRNEVPNNVSGKALSVADHSTNEILSVIATGEYEIVSTGETLVPYIAPGTESNYVGGIFISGDKKYIIHEVTLDTQGPIFTVYKKEISDSIVNGDGIPSTPPVGELESPELVPDGLFMAIENMQNPGNWGAPNPLSFKVSVGDNWEINREVLEITDASGQEQRVVEKTRGIWEEAKIAIDNGANEPGIYKIEFNNFILDQHPQQDSDEVSAEWYRGIVRIFTEGSVTGNLPDKPRKILPVIKIENIDTDNLILYVQDPAYDEDDINYDKIITGNNIMVNFYPGYKAYLYENTPYGMNEQNILPAEGEGVRYSIFGLRSLDNDGGCDPVSGNCQSKISVPCLMFAQELIEALPPEQPEGALYATRPDFFGRSTYTLTTKYQHKPHGVLFYRSNDEAFLNALYEKDTIRDIRESLETLGGNNEEYLTNRWNNFLNFDELAVDGDYKVYPPTEVSQDGYKFPNPDKQTLFDWANHILTELGEPLITDNPGTLTVGDPKIINFVRGAIYNTFVSLTEMPILYQYLESGTYMPVDKPQMIKDRNGNLLQPGSDNFEMAPMMKIIGTLPHETLFTDFKLDGTSNNLYFYGAKELSTQMKMSDFSPFLGPIKLVNTNAPETPEIKRIIPVIENTVLGITPKIQLEINAFPKVQNIKKITVYRAFNILDAQSVLTMQQVKIIDIEDEDLSDEPVWTITDNFDDLSEIPYGDGLFYRITVSREVKYSDSEDNTVIEYAPSQVSKIVVSLIVEANAPQSPVLKFLSTPPDINDEIHSVSLQWVKTAYNAKYHIYKMNSQGNWTEIHQLQTNDDEIQLPLSDTDLQSNTLKLTNDEGDTVYHHFKVLAENTAGMLSTEENILTIFNEDDWIEI